jgi:hypothetical protein
MSTRQTITAGVDSPSTANHRPTDKELSERLDDLNVRSDAALHRAHELVRKHSFTREELEEARARLEEIICQSEELTEYMEERKRRQHMEGPFSNRRPK